MIGGLFGAEVDARLFALLLRNGRRCTGQRVAAAGRLRECHHLADRVRTDECRSEAVETERDAAMRWRSVAERLEQEAELALRLFPRQSDHIEDALLHLAPVDTNRSAAQLHPVADDVVS